MPTWPCIMVGCGTTPGKPRTPCLSVCSQLRNSCFYSFNLTPGGGSQMVRGLLALVLVRYNFVTEVSLRLSPCRRTEETRQRLISFAFLPPLLRLFLLCFRPTPSLPPSCGRRRSRSTLSLSLPDVFLLCQSGFSVRGDDCDSKIGTKPRAISLISYAGCLF